VFPVGSIVKGESAFPKPGVYRYTLLTGMPLVLHMPILSTMDKPAWKK
jgi:hypothetical protein